MVMSKRNVSKSQSMGELTSKERNFYLAGMLGQNIICTLVATAISMFYTDVLLIDVVAVGLIMMFAQIWDAVNDPIMGVIVDHTNTKDGKCIPYLKVIPIPIFIMTVAIFFPVTNFPMTGRIIYAAVTYVVYTMVYTVGDIPLWTVCSLVTRDERKRTSLISAARVVGNLSIIISLVFFDIKNVFGKINLGLFPDTGLPNYDGYFSQSQGYLISVFLIALVGTVLFMLVGPNVKERIRSNPDAKKNSVKDDLKTMFKNRPFVRIVLSGILGSTRMVVTISGVYFCKWVLGNGNEGMWFAMLGGAFLVGFLVSMGVSPAVSRKFGKKNVYIWTSYLSAVPYLILLLLGYKSVALIITLMVLGGFLSGFVMVLQTAMVADSIDYMEYKTGKRNDALYFSGMTFIAKLTTGITVLVTNLLLGTVNYTEIVNKISADLASGALESLNFATAYPEVANILFILITVVPAVGCILQAIPMHGYEFNDKQYNEMMVELNARRDAAQKDN